MEAIKLNSYGTCRKKKMLSLKKQKNTCTARIRHEFISSKKNSPVTRSAYLCINHVTTTNTAYGRAICVQDKVGEERERIKISDQLVRVYYY